MRGAILFEFIHRHANTCGTVEMYPYPDCLPSSGLEFICRIPVHSFLPSTSLSVSPEPREPFLDPSKMLKTNQIKSFLSAQRSYSFMKETDGETNELSQSLKDLARPVRERRYEGEAGHNSVPRGKIHGSFSEDGRIVRQKVSEDIVGRGTSIFEVPENGKSLGHSQRK